MPEFYTWVILLINQSDKIDENQRFQILAQEGPNKPLKAA